MNEKINNTATNRNVFLDVLRVAATCAVVLLHTLTGAVDALDINQYPMERRVFLVTMDLITWCVPIFVLISGYLFLNPKKQITMGVMLKKYCRRIVLALVVFGVPYAVLELILVERTFRWPMVGQGLLMVLQGKSWSHMWYLYMILFLYLLTPALKWLLARVPDGCIYAVMAFFLLFSSIFTFSNKLFDSSLPTLPDAGIYLFYYLCGYLFVRGEYREMGARNVVQTELPCEKAVAGRVHLILAGAVLIGMALSRIGWNFSVQMAYNYPFTILVAVLLFGGMKSCAREWAPGASSLWQRLSALCFTIYLVHPVFVNVLYKFLHISLLDYPIGIALPLFFTVILLLAVIAAWVLCKIPLLKKYVL